MTPGSLFDSTVHVLGHDGLDFIADAQLDDLRLSVCGRSSGAGSAVRLCVRCRLRQVGREKGRAKSQEPNPEKSRGHRGHIVAEAARRVRVQTERVLIWRKNLNAD